MLRGLSTYLGGPARLDDIVTVVGVVLNLPGFAGLPCGSPILFPEPSESHVTYEQMDAMVENTLDAAVRDSIVAHTGECSFCARQLAAYQSAAPHVSAPFQKAQST